MLARMKRTFLWLHFVLAALVAVLVFLQAYLITAYVSGAGEDALDAHGFVGFAIIHPAEALVFLTALVAWWRNWTMIGLSLFLIVFGTVQIFLAPPDEDPASGWVHGLHGLFALLVMVTAAWIAWRDAPALGLRQPAAGAAGTAPPRSDL
jgi:hypothetical protein